MTRPSGQAHTCAGNRGRLTACSGLCLEAEPQKQQRDNDLAILPHEMKMTFHFQPINLFGSDQLLNEHGMLTPQFHSSEEIVYLGEGRSKAVKGT
jgi:hypothetical protein